MALIDGFPTKCHPKDRTQPARGRPAGNDRQLHGANRPAGILPAHYTEYLIARSYSGDDAAAAFFRPIQPPSDFAVLSRLGENTISRLPISGSLNHSSRAAVHWRTCLIHRNGDAGFAGAPGAYRLRRSSLLRADCATPHSAVTLAGLLRDYFACPIEIDQFVGQMVSTGG